MNTRHQRGVSLVDLALVLAIVGVVASMALPSYQAQINKSRRADAVAALTRLHAAQEQFRAHHGSYALRLGALGGVGGAGGAGGTTSDQGHYTLTMATAHADGFIARARVADGAPRDSGCSELTLSVADGVAAHGPSARCWNR